MSDSSTHVMRGAVVIRFDSATVISGNSVVLPHETARRVVREMLEQLGQSTPFDRGAFAVSVRLQNALTRLGFWSWETAVFVTEKDLRMSKNVGDNTIKEFITTRDRFRRAQVRR